MILGALLAALMLASPAAPVAPASVKPKKDTTPRKLGAGAQKKPPEKQREVDVKGDLLEVLNARHQAVFKGHVVAVSEDVTVSCDRGTVTYGEQSKVKSLACEGNTHVLQLPRKDAREPTSREAWGEHAVFNNETRVLVLTGSPRMKEGDSTVEAKTITFNISENKALAEGDVKVKMDAPPGGLEKKQ